MEFLHQVVAVPFDRTLGRAKIERDLLIQFAANERRRNSSHQQLAQVGKCLTHSLRFAYDNGTSLRQREPLTSYPLESVFFVLIRFNPRAMDNNATWRIFYFIDSAAIVLLEITDKTTRGTPKRVMDNCKRRLKNYETSRGSDS